MLIQELLEAKWSGDVKSKWHPTEGFFKQPAGRIATELKAASKDLKQAMSRLNFFINRSGDNLDDSAKANLEKAKQKLHDLYEKDEK